ncbi:MAG: SulP family inorganic anion transporter, partial [Acidobacteriota bacterium]|nr:SulP family inorganic anion transporter [Acidobacteriota bacterium]
MTDPDQPARSSGAPTADETAPPPAHSRRPWPAPSPARASLPDWLPRSILALSRGYRLRTFTQDAVAGITVGLVALPLAMAFAIASGLTPQAGIYCAIITGFLVSALGGSRYQIGGPTGAFVVVVSGIVAQYGLDGLFMCTLMAGVMLVAMGLTGTGSAVKYIPRPVIVGFTNGIALVIASTQFRDFLGLSIEVPGDFLDRLEVIGAHLADVSWPSILLGTGSLVAILLCNRFAPRVPGYIVALFGGTLVALAAGLDVASIGSRFGGIPSGLPALHVPQFRPRLMLQLLSPAITVAMLGAIESLLSAVVADRMGRDRHNPNTELVAQGVANIVSPLFGGLPATGAIARTATNIRSGARTPVAGMLHAITLLGVLLFAAPLAAHVPLPVLAAILFVVARNMGEWGEIRDLLKQSYTDIAVWLATFLLTVLADLTVAVEVGMVLAALLFIRRVSQTTTVSRATSEYVEDSRRHILQDKEIPDGVAIFRI